MTPQEIKDNGLTKLVMYGVCDGIGSTATNKLGKDINVPCKTTPTEIVTELRKIATYSTSKKVVCTEAADLIEEYKEGLSIIRSVIFDYDGYDPKNAEQMKALVDECFGMCSMILNGETLTVSPEDFDKEVKKLNERKREYI